MTKSEERLLLLWHKYGNPLPRTRHPDNGGWDFYCDKPPGEIGPVLRCAYCHRVLTFVTTSNDDIYGHRDACQVRKDFAEKMMLYPPEVT